jgi:hypothetical protein
VGEDFWKLLEGKNFGEYLEGKFGGKRFGKDLEGNFEKEILGENLEGIFWMEMFTPQAIRMSLGE